MQPTPVYNQGKRSSRCLWSLSSSHKQSTRKPPFQVEGDVENSGQVLGVLSGGDIDFALLERWAKSATRVYAADAGADLLMRVGALPHLTIGDMDSISPEALSAAAFIDQSRDQETTDCEKLLTRVAHEGHPEVTLIGVEGDLPDHVLATLHAAARFDLDVRIVYRRGMGWILKPDLPRVLPTVPGRRVSLLPIEACRGATLRGVQWELTDMDLSPRGNKSISNRAAEVQIRAGISSGAALLFLEVPPEEMPIW